MLPFDVKKPLFGFKMRFPHAERRIHVFSNEAHSLVYFRPKHAAKDWCGGLWTNYRTPHRESYHRWERKCRTWLQKEQFFRVFVLPDPRKGEERLWCLWWRPDCGYVIPLNHPADLEGAFFSCESKSSPSLTRASTEQLHAHFEQEWCAPYSDVREALSWCDLMHEEREWRSIRWEHGGREEVESVTIAACIVETEWDKGHNLRLRFIIGSQGKRRPDTDLTIYAAVFETKWNNQGRLNRIFKRLKERNCGSYNMPAGARNDWLFPSAPFKRKSSHHRSASITLNITPPTQHERLEASLFLRNWLRENAPDLLPDWFPDAL